MNQTQALNPLHGGDYPTSFDHVIGQEKAKEQLLTAARSAKLRGVPLPHTLLAKGSPGIGKTTLALLIGQEMGSQVKVASGKIKAAQARLLLAGMADGDVLVIDEVHLLVGTSKQDASWLLNYMQDWVLLGPLGPEEQPRVTIIGCTTDGGKLPETILDRFELQPEMTDYTDAQGADIALIMADRVFTGMAPPTKSNCAAIALAANNNPRRIKALLKTLRDIVLVHEVKWSKSKGYDLTRLLANFGLTEDGLSPQAQAYLTILFNDFAGEPAGATTLRDRLQEPGGLELTERVLMSKGLIAKTRGGRTLTQPGIRRARQLSGL